MELLIPAAPDRAIVLSATLPGTLSAVMVPATKRTTQILPARIAGIGQELDAAVSAVRHAPTQLGMTRQDRLERDPILIDERLGAIVLVPVRAKRENFLDRDYKKAKLPVTISSVLDTPSSYHLEAVGIERLGEVFYCAASKNQNTTRRIPTNQHTFAKLPALPF